MCFWCRPVLAGLALALCPNCHVINKEPVSSFTSPVECIQIQKCAANISFNGRFEALNNRTLNLVL